MIKLVKCIYSNANNPKNLNKISTVGKHGLHCLARYLTAYFWVRWLSTSTVHITSPSPSTSI